MMLGASVWCLGQQIYLVGLVTSFAIDALVVLAVLRLTRSFLTTEVTRGPDVAVARIK